MERDMKGKWDLQRKMKEGEEVSTTCLGFGRTKMRGK